MNFKEYLDYKDDILKDDVNAFNIWNLLRECNYIF